MVKYIKITEKRGGKMISEKIKIYVTKEVERIIDKDAESFEFFRKDGKELNRNALITRLVVNYSDTFYKRRAEIAELVAVQLRDEGVNPNSILSLSMMLAERAAALGSVLGSGKCDRPISLKPTRASSGIIEYIEARCLHGTSLSEHFRNMLTSYASLPQDERERIIFKEEYETLASAINDGKQVFLSLRGVNVSPFSASPYALEKSKEELHTYLLISSDKGVSVVRLSRIESAVILGERAVFAPDDEEIFEKMIKHGPQFTYFPGEGEAVIELTEDGVKKFRRMYVHRPTPDRIEGNRYYFTSSHAQLMQYFCRFGKEAYVLSPRRLRSNMLRFYKRAVSSYTEREKPCDNA